MSFNRIETIRREKGFSLRDLCKRLSNKNICVCDIENELHKPTKTEERVIAKALGVTVDYVFPDIRLVSAREILSQGHAATLARAKKSGGSLPEAPDNGHSMGTEGE